jgi:hypothetical protein
MSNSFVNTGVVVLNPLSDKEHSALIEVQKAVNGLSVQEAEKVLRSMLDQIKDNSVIQFNSLS